MFAMHLKMAGSVLISWWNCYGNTILQFICADQIFKEIIITIPVHPFCPLGSPYKLYISIPQYQLQFYYSLRDCGNYSKKLNFNSWRKLAVVQVIAVLWLIINFYPYLMLRVESTSQGVPPETWFLQGYRMVDQILLSEINNTFYINNLCLLFANNKLFSLT